MRKWLLIFVLILAGCGGDASVQPLQSISTQPRIDGITISPDSVVQMEGGGKVVVTVDLAVYDAGMDIASLWVRKPDGEVVDFAESLLAVSGTITESFNVSTDEVGVHSVEFWLIDRGGSTSGHRTADFTVNWDLPVSEWTSRLSGLPYGLNDVIWDGSVFIAVGGDGAILTSPDGIDWVVRDSGTESTLRSIAAWGSDIVAIGDDDDVVLLSTDHGMSWVTRNSPADVDLEAVAISSAQIVIGGHVPDPDADPDGFGAYIPVIVLSGDRGETWKAVELQSREPFPSFSDLVYADKRFVATVNEYDPMSGAGARVLVSSDGTSWNEVVQYHLALSTVIHDGSRFVVGGYGTVLMSLDGYNWTEFEEPVGLDYSGAAWNGSKLMLAGGCGWGGCGPDEIEYPAGISTVDGGASWDIFDIDGDYVSEGLAWGNGRFVSVGDGAIYTTE